MLFTDEFVNRLINKHVTLHQNISILCILKYKNFTIIKPNIIYSNTKRQFSMHAEVNALMAANFNTDVKECYIIYIVNIDGKYKLINKYPCKKCTKLFKKYGIYDKIKKYKDN